MCQIHLLNFIAINFCSHLCPVVAYNNICCVVIISYLSDGNYWNLFIAFVRGEHFLKNYSYIRRWREDGGKYACTLYGNINLIKGVQMKNGSNKIITNFLLLLVLLLRHYCYFIRRSYLLFWDVCANIWQSTKIMTNDMDQYIVGERC